VQPVQHVDPLVEKKYRENLYASVSIFYCRQMYYVCPTCGLYNDITGLYNSGGYCGEDGVDTTGTRVVGLPFTTFTKCHIHTYINVNKQPLQTLLQRKTQNVEN
jgi:hypothetical protein